MTRPSMPQSDTEGSLASAETERPSALQSHAAPSHPTTANDPKFGTLSLHDVTALLYSAGRAFDNLTSTRLATREFLRTGNPAVLGSKWNLGLLQDLRAASRMMVSAVERQTPINLALLQSLNAALTRTAAIEPGVLRQQDNILVSTPIGTYHPPIPSAERLEEYCKQAQQSSASFADGALLFARLARAQPFGDGNKRSAFFMANTLLLKHAKPYLIMPVEQPDAEHLQQLLARWYLHDDAALIAWLAQWNERYWHDKPRV